MMRRNDVVLCLLVMFMLTFAFSYNCPHETYDSCLALAPESLSGSEFVVANSNHLETKPFVTSNYIGFNDIAGVQTYIKMYDIATTTVTSIFGGMPNVPDWPSFGFKYADEDFMTFIDWGNFSVPGGIWFMDFMPLI